MAPRVLSSLFSRLRVGRRTRRVSGVGCLVSATAMLFGAIGTRAGSERPLRIGSKKFTESYVLAELAKGELAKDGIAAEHRPGMGGTIILWRALEAGEIDAYPEYTGTISEEILKNGSDAPEALRAGLAAHGVAMGGELGFNNTYALVVTKETAARLKLAAISDLAAHPELRYGLTHEFLGRRDGWPGLAAKYGLPADAPRGIDHALGYAALKAGEIDVKDAYSTDAKLGEYGLVTLRDDRNYFPRYRAVFLYWAGLDPAAIRALRRLAGTIDEPEMIRLNAAAEASKDYAAAAALHGRAVADATAPARPSRARRIAGWSLRHLELSGLGLLAALLIGLPLGLIAAHGGVAGQLILGACGVIQTVPSLALLALLVPIPGLGISPRTAVLALLLYGLLPIVRNTATGLQSIPPALRESAAALGLTPGAQLRQVFLPLASRTILAGIKTSAIWILATATLAALIGAGGLGEPIVSGLNLNDPTTLLEGAIPAALLALAIQGLFELLDRVLVPKGLRLKAGE